MNNVTDLFLNPIRVKKYIQGLVKDSNCVRFHEAIEKNMPDIALSAIFKCIENADIYTGPHRDSYGNICCTLKMPIQGSMIYITLAIVEKNGSDYLNVQKIEEG